MENDGQGEQRTPAGRSAGSPVRKGGSRIRLTRRPLPRVEPYGTEVRVRRCYPLPAVQVAGTGPRPLLGPVLRASRVVFRGRLVEVRVDRFRAGGRTVEREVVNHPGAVAVVALTSDREVILLRQYRYPVRARLWEIPAGTLRPGEKPLAAAQRELEEETGYRAGDWVQLAEFYTTPGFCSEKMVLYLARDLQEGCASPEEDEDLEVSKVPWDLAMGWVKEGRLQDAKTILGLLLARPYLDADIPGGGGA